MANFPSSLPTYAGFTSSETLQVAGHASQHNAEQGDITAIATKIGTGASTPTSNNVLVGNGVGTSTWGQVGLSTGVSGILPVTSGGTGTGTSTGTGSVVLNSTPTTNNETATNLTSTKLNNSGGLTNTGGATTDTQTITGNATVGGTLGVTGVATFTGGFSNATMSNPYKFSVYMSSSQTVTANTWTKLNLNTTIFDTGSNFDITTNHQFTAPVTGFYQFSGVATPGALSSGVCDIGINVGTFSTNPTYIATSQPSINSVAISISVLISLTASQTVQFYTYGPSTTSYGGQPNCFLTGFLVSAT